MAFERSSLNWLGGAAVLAVATVSILSFIEKRWGLTALSTRDAAANPFSNAFSF